MRGKSATGEAPRADHLTPQAIGIGLIRTYRPPQEGASVKLRSFNGYGLQRVPHNRASCSVRPQAGFLPTQKSSLAKTNPRGNGSQKDCIYQIRCEYGSFYIGATKRPLTV